MRPAASDASVTVGVAVTAAAESSLAARVALLPAAAPLDALVGVPARDPWSATLETGLSRGTDTGPFATDVLTLPAVNPWNALVRPSGIDFLSADEAAVCTWDGDVWTEIGRAHV